jgi:aconitate hydratase
MNALDPLGLVDAFPDVPAPASIYRLDRVPGFDRERFGRRPLTIRILAENLARNLASSSLDPKRLTELLRGDSGPKDLELPFYPSRVLLQDFTGVPVLVDLAALRGAAVASGLSPDRVNPVVPVDLVVDHSVQVDSYGAPGSIRINLDREYERNSERYQFLRWARGAFDQIRVVPPGNGIVHQVNLEYLATVVTHRAHRGSATVFPDSVVGTDSHTTMINGLGVLAWGVGGIEAEAAMMGEPCYLAHPTVVGVRLTGRLPEGATATDLVLTLTRALRRHGVVDKFVEFYGPGVAHLAVADRATISNMCPEYGATSALFPIDEVTLTYLERTGRTGAEVDRVRRYAKLQGLWDTGSLPHLEYDERLEVDLASIVPTIAGPRNPEESTPLSNGPASFRAGLEEFHQTHPTAPDGAPMSAKPVSDGSVVIAAITSCTNTSNPTVMVGAGLMARAARERGLSVPPWVKTSLAPGSKVVTEYLRKAGLLPSLSALGFDVVGYGCTTCIGNSGPLDPEVDRQVRERDLYVGAVLSGNRNFEARIHTLVRANYLASPMLVVAYALAGRMDVDLTKDPLGKDKDGHAVYLRDLWPKSEDIRRAVEESLDPATFREQYQKITVGDAHWEGLPLVTGTVYPWAADSTYLRDPPYFDGSMVPKDSTGPWLPGARALAVLGDRVTTDHISPAGEIGTETPAGQYLIQQGVAPRDFNTYGTRRGNHEVMVRGTFANVRLKNLLVAPKEGGVTVHLPEGGPMSIYDAALRYRSEGVPTVVFAGQSYGQGSSRDWAAKGPMLLGVRAVVAETYERIHRSNLVGMGVVPLEFHPGENLSRLGLTGRERFDIELPKSGLQPRAEATMIAREENGIERTRFRVRSRIESETEMEYYRAGGLLPYVLRRLAA